MKPTTLRYYKERLLRVLVHIQERLDEPLPLAELARLGGLAPHHFHHVFRGMLGESLAAHVRRLRLERAAWRLKLSHAPVMQLALEAGYESHEAFSRAFRNSFGLSPTQFRQRRAVLPVIAATSGVHHCDEAKLTNFRSRPAGDKAMKIVIRKPVPVRVAFLRHPGPYDEVGKTWEQFTLLLGKEGWLGGGTRFIGICHDDPAVTPPDRIRYDACATVDGKFRAAGEIGVQIIPGGDYAVMTHFGAYDRLGESYAKLLGQWLPRSGRKLRSTPCFEEYFNSPENTAPEDLVTDIFAPLEPTRHKAATENHYECRHKARPLQTASRRVRDAEETRAGTYQARAISGDRRPGRPRRRPIHGMPRRALRHGLHHQDDAQVRRQTGLRRLQARRPVVL